MDELSTTGVSRVVELRGGTFSSFGVHPSDAGLPTARLSDLEGGSPKDSAIAMRDLLRGKPGPFRDIVLLNASAAFIIAGKAASLKEGARLAAASIDRGGAQKALDALILASTDAAAAQPELAVDAK
jgi:anthranilate phosphoribosyltransferase